MRIIWLAALLHRCELTGKSWGGGGGGPRVYCTLMGTKLGPSLLLLRKGEADYSDGTLQRQFLFWKLCGLSPNSHIHLSVSDLYIPRIGQHISSSRKGRPIAGIYNSLTDTWMWKLGLRPRYSFSGNICYKFSAFCLCSVAHYLWKVSENAKLYFNPKKV